MASSTVQYGRAIRPFQTQRLLDALAGLQARSAHVGGVMARLSESERHGPEAYRHELGQAMDCLVELSEAAGLVFDACEVAYDSADADWARAMDAALRVWRADQATAA